MPIILRDDMTDMQILKNIAAAYASQDSYRAYEIDTGHGPTTQRAWIERDRGEYARRGLAIIANNYKRQEGQTQS